MEDVRTGLLRGVPEQFRRPMVTAPAIGDTCVLLLSATSAINIPRHHFPKRTESFLTIEWGSARRNQIPMFGFYARHADNAP